MKPKINFVPEAWVKIKDLKEHPKNPRKDLTQDEHQFGRLKQSILEGVFEPVKVSKRSGFCLAGNQRLKAFKALGIDEIPVQYNTYENEEDELRDMIKDNNEWGEYDYMKLNQDLAEMSLDMANLGLSDSDMKMLQKLTDALDETEDAKIIGTFEVIVDCPNEAEQQRLYEELVGEGYNVKVLTI